MSLANSFYVRANFRMLGCSCRSFNLNGRFLFMKVDFHETRNVFDTGMASLLTISIGYSQCCKISFSLLWIASEMASWYALVVTLCNICRGICTGHVKTTIWNLCYEYCLLWFHWIVFAYSYPQKPESFILCTIFESVYKWFFASMSIERGQAILLAHHLFYWQFWWHA